MLDPDAERYVQAVRAAPPMNRLGVAAAREAARARKIAPVNVDLLSVNDRTVDGPHGPVPIRIYRDAHERLPAILYFHAGGWMLGDLNHSDGLCRVLTKHSRCVVINVDYRLSPENPFPNPLDDCAAVLKWTVANADALGIDPARIAIAGESSGAHLAAALALKARDEGVPLPALQVLSCPCIDPEMNSKSWADFGADFSPVREQMDWMWRAFLPAASDRMHPYAAPLHAADLSGLPPALVLTAEYDPLRDEGEAYAARLAAAGVKVESRRQAGHVHAFLNLGGVVPSAVGILTALAERIGQALRSRG
jgi:acetyl esterase